MLLKNGKIYTMKGDPVPSGDIRIERGQIRQIGTDIKPQKDEEVYDLKGLSVFPGFIDAHCHLGVYSEPHIWANDDGNEESDPLTPHVRAIDAINPFDPAFEHARKAGITSVFTGPGSANVIGGQSAYIKTIERTVVDQMVVEPFCGMKAAMGENPKRVHGSRKNSPMTRMGVAAVMREALTKAKNYMNGRKKKEGKPEFDFKMEALSAVLKREVPLRCHAHRADDIATIIRIRDEFDIDLVIEHATQGHIVADYIAEKRVPCIVGPSMTTVSKEELSQKGFHTAYELNKKGVLIAIMTDAPVIPINHLPEMVGYAIREGLPWEEGLKAVTINPARICGMDSRVGSLEIGKDADIAVYEGDPFTIQGRCRLTIINGEIAWNDLQNS